MNIENENTKTEVKTKKKKKKKKKKSKNIGFRQEVLRKSIHLLSLAIPIAYIFVDKLPAILILLPMAILAVILDILSKVNNRFRQIYIDLFGDMLRKHEKKKKKIILNGASWVLISAVIMVIVFPKIIVVTAFTILILSDISAALVGRKYGKHKLFNKTWEGTAAFIVTAFFVVLAYGIIFSAPISYYIFGFAGAIVSGLIEAASKVLKLDDNLTIPISAGIIMWIGSLFAEIIDKQYIYII
jgi:dolichol kinase